MPVTIDKKQLHWDDYRILVTFQIFAKGAGQYAGQGPNFDALREGMDAVFRWWCKNGIYVGGEPDFKDVAAQVAMEVARRVYEQDTVSNAVDDLLPSWLAYSCLPPLDADSYPNPYPTPPKIPSPSPSPLPPTPGMRPIPAVPWPLPRPTRPSGHVKSRYPSRRR